MNQTIYVTNPDNAISGIVASANGNVTVINNTSGEPFKILGLKILVGAASSIGITIGAGSGQITLASTPSIGDIIDVLGASSSIGTGIDSNGSRYILLQAGATVVVGAVSAAHRISYFYESYTA